MSEKKDGLKCPVCGCSDLRTPNVINIPGAIRRYKICRYCGKRVRTKEVIEVRKNEDTEKTETIPDPDIDGTETEQDQDSSLRKRIRRRLK